MKRSLDHLEKLACMAHANETTRLAYTWLWIAPHVRNLALTHCGVWEQVAKVCRNLGTRITP